LPADLRFILDHQSAPSLRTGAGRHREKISMKSPEIIVAVTLTAAILIAASLLVFAGTRKSTGTSTLNVPALHSQMPV
jgi:hypothetical protein